MADKAPDREGRDPREYGVVRCPKCRRVRGIFLAIRTSKCPVCAITKPIDALPLLAKAGTPDEMQRLVATFQAKEQGEDAAIEEAALAADLAERRALVRGLGASEPRTSQAASKARNEPVGARRWRRLFEALSEEGPFTEEEAREAAEAAALAPAETQRMVARFRGEASLVELPRGRWLWVGE